MALVNQSVEDIPRTSEIEFFSSLHGREKRLQRGIEKRDLQGQLLVRILELLATTHTSTGLRLAPRAGDDGRSISTNSGAEVAGLLPGVSLVVDWLTGVMSFLLGASVFWSLAVTVEE